MVKYVDVLLTIDGYFCVAPICTVNEGDLISLPDAFTGEDKLHEVIAVSTDDESGDHIKMIEKYIGCPLHKITTKYLKREVEWNVADNDR